MSVSHHHTSLLRALNSMLPYLLPFLALAIVVEAIPPYVTLKVHHVVFDNRTVTIELTCETSSNPFISTFRWYKGGRVIREGTGATFYRYRFNLEARTEGLYACRSLGDISNEWGTSEQVEVRKTDYQHIGEEENEVAPASTSTTTTTTIAPSTSPPQEVSVEMGQTQRGRNIIVDLFCRISADPYSSTFEWYKNGQLVRRGSGTGASHYQFILSSRTYGRYHCRGRVADSLRWSSSEDTYVDNVIAPSTTIAPTTTAEPSTELPVATVVLEVGHRVEGNDTVIIMNCRSLSDPDVTLYEWYKNGEVFRRGTGQLNTRMEFYLSRDTTGIYSCRAKDPKTNEWSKSIEFPVGENHQPPQCIYPPLAAPPVGCQYNFSYDPDGCPLHWRLECIPCYVCEDSIESGSTCVKKNDITCALEPDSGNRIWRKPDECAAVCKNDTISPVCKETSEIFPCLVAETRWEYNPDLKSCQSFLGCPGTGNNFNSEKDCNRMCQQGKPVIRKLDVCEQTMVTGPCKAAFRRWYYNKDAKECESFLYGGCQPNQNNFDSLASCQATCFDEPPKQCPEDKPLTNCFADPCKTTICSAVPDAQCRPDFCGGCSAKFFNKDGKEVDCKAREPVRCVGFCSNAKCPKCSVCGESHGRCGCFEQITPDCDVDDVLTTTTLAPRDDFCLRAKCPDCTSCKKLNGQYGCYEDRTLPGCGLDPCQPNPCGECQRCIATKRICADIIETCPQYTCNPISGCPATTVSTEVPLDQRCPIVNHPGICPRLGQCMFHHDCREGRICCNTPCGKTCELPLPVLQH